MCPRNRGNPRTDIKVPPICPRTDEDRAALQAFEDEVIDRLYVLNAERAREEERLGLGSKKGAKNAGGTQKTGKKTRRKGAGKSEPDEQEELF